MIQKSLLDEVQIQDVGAIELVNIPLGPGRIVKFFGDNGVGKSTAINAIASAIDGEKRGLQPRDGKMSGKIRLPGRTVTVGARFKSTPTGDVAQSYVIVEDGSGIKKILNPGLKDVVAADKKRLEGVLDVIGAKLSIERQREFLGEHYAGFAAARKVDGLPFVDTVKEMKLYLEEVARGYNKKVAESTGAIVSIGDIADDVEIPESVESLAGRLSDLTLASRDASRARDAADTALKALGEAVEEEDLDTKRQVIGSTLELIKSHEDEILHLQMEVSEAKLLLTKTEASLDAAVKAAVQRESMRKAVDTAKSVEEIDAMLKELSELTASHKAAVIASGDNERRAADRAKLAKLKSEREKSEAGHESIRKVIEDLPTLLTEALKSVPGWTVDEDMRLCVEHKRGVIPFSELSPGEGTSRVSLLACHFASYGEGELPIVALPQECFEGLDGKNRKILLDCAIEHGLCIITAEAPDENDGDVKGIRVDVLS